MRIILLVLISSLTAHAGIFNEFSPWQKLAVKVCFADQSDDFSTLNYFHDGSLNDIREDIFGPWQEEQKLFVKELIQSEYTKENTLVHFVGWQDCPSHIESSDIDVILYTSKTNLNNYFMEFGRASLGNNSQFDKSVKSKKAFLYIGHPLAFKADFEKMNYKGDLNLYWSYTLVHEFGHLAGLLHEQDQKEVLLDKNCPEGTAQSIARVTRNFEKQTYKYKYGEYDQNSIMNYCFLNTYRDKEKEPIRNSILSEQDIETLRKIYSN